MRLRDYLYRIDVRPDGTWLVLNAPGKEPAMIRLESLKQGPVVKEAIADVRACLQELKPTENEKQATIFEKPQADMKKATKIKEHSDDLLGRSG